MKKDYNQEELEALSFYNFVDKFLNKISSAFKKTINKIGISFLYFFYVIKKYFIVISLTSSLGLGAGFYFLYKNGTTYNSSFIAKLSFNSGRVLYKLFTDINDLMLREEYEQIAKILDIPSDDAKHLYGFDLRKISNDIDDARMYRQYLYEVDTNFYKPIDREKYIKSLPLDNYTYQDIVIYSAGKINYKLIQDRIISYLNKNPYLNRQKNSYLEAMGNQMITLAKNNRNLDSLYFAKIQFLKESGKTNKGNESNLLIGENAKLSQNTDEWILDKSLNNQVEIGKIQNFIYENADIAIPVTNAHDGVRESRARFILTWLIKGFLFGFLIVLLYEFYNFIDRKQKAVF